MAGGGAGPPRGRIPGPGRGGGRGAAPGAARCNPAHPAPPPQRNCRCCPSCLQHTTPVTQKTKYVLEYDVGTTLLAKPNIIFFSQC
jgi:hypothetical protein